MVGANVNIILELDYEFCPCINEFLVQCMTQALLWHHNENNSSVTVVPGIPEVKQEDSQVKGGHVLYYEEKFLT